MRTHVALPTVEDIKLGEQFFSDHLPVFFSVPCYGVLDGYNPNESRPIHIISLSLLNDIRYSGLHEESSNSEGSQQQLKRYQKIVKGFKKAITNHHVDVILLQEASSDSPILSYLRRTLGDSWVIIDTGATGLISCYNAERFIMSKVKPNLNAVERILTLTLDDVYTGETVSISNIWGKISPTPFNGIEERIINVLKESLADTAILIGNTNSRIAPIDSTARNITTANVAFNAIYSQDAAYEAGRQLSDFPEGGFYRAQGSQINQLNNRTLDFITGEFIEDTRPKAERNHYPGYRLIVYIDSQARNNPLINKKAKDEYQTYLNSSLDNNLVIHPAANDNNEKAIALLFPARNFAYNQILKNVSACIPDYQTQTLSHNCLNSAVSFYGIMVPIEKSNQLHDIIEQCIALQNQLNAVILMALQGIEQYQNYKMDRLALFFRPLERKRGYRRAAIYQSAFENSDYTFENKLVILFSLLISKDGDHLKDCLVEKLAPLQSPVIDSNQSFKASLDTTQKYVVRIINEHYSIPIDELHRQAADIIKRINFPPKILPKPASLVLDPIFHELQQSLNELKC